MVSRMAAAAVYIVLIGAVTVAGSVAIADTGAEGYDRADRINESAVEAALAADLNELRADRGVSTLSTHTQASTEATAWSARMANGTYEHSPRGYYTCRAAENIATLPAYGDVQLRNGEIDNYHGNETAIAEGLIGVWNRSPPHRANMLDRAHTSQAVGIAVAEKNGTVTVYATQAFCTAT
jgi:uncharacterized protein YkwD